VPAEGSKQEKIAVLCQRLADTFAEGIAAHPADWHMLQRLWLVDLDPQHAAARGDEHAADQGKGQADDATAPGTAAPGSDDPPARSEVPSVDLVEPDGAR
jgi:phosphatidylinositol dimannoside acyltransferase